MLGNQFKNFYSDFDKQRTAAEDVVKPKINRYYTKELTSIFNELLRKGQINCLLNIFLIWVLKVII